MLRQISVEEPQFLQKHCLCKAAGYVLKVKGRSRISAVLMLENSINGVKNTTRWRPSKKQNEVQTDRFALVKSYFNNSTCSLVISIRISKENSKILAVSIFSSCLFSSSLFVLFI